MKKQFVKDLKPGDKVVTFFVAQHKQLEYFRDKTKGQFLTVVLADKTGRILGRAWENAEQLYGSFNERDVIAVRGYVDTYLDKPQVIVEKLRPARPDERDTRFSEDDFVPQTVKDVDLMWEVVLQAVRTITNPHLKALLDDLLNNAEIVSGLRQAPATKAMHHSYRGGLLEHITEMITLGRTLLTLYPALDADLLMAGIILHDIGTIYGAHAERGIDYSDAGRLVGHIVLGDRLVSHAIARLSDFPPELAMRLSHLILSHHGEAEQGAVREPMTLEASALFLLNELSAGVNHVQQVLDAEWDISRTWTEFDRLLGRSFYRGQPPTPPASTPDQTPPSSTSG
jgi:3'-5' exoribonuclease